MPANRARLRDRRLTLKPRIIVAHGLVRGFWVERINPNTKPHPSIRGMAECIFTDDFPSAVAQAQAWAPPKPQEAQWAPE